MTSAFGKAILLGEHAVVHGHPALAAAIDYGVTVQSAPAPALRLRAPRWDLDVAATDDHPVARAMVALARALASEPLEFTCDATVPAAAGLGSSAALSVAMARAIAVAAGRTLSQAELEAAADAAERCFHDNPSGVDVALASRGGVGLYRRGHGLQAIDAAPFCLAVGLSGEPRSTAAMVGRVSRALEDDRAATAHHLEALGGAAERGAEALRTGDVQTLGLLMAEAHHTLATLGVSTAALDRMVELATDAGALGAKLTGAGGGGAVLALAPQREEAIAQAWRQAGFQAFVCVAGVTP